MICSKCGGADIRMLPLIGKSERRRRWRCMGCTLEGVESSGFLRPATLKVVTTFEEHDHVRKKSGYKWPGIVVSAFKTLDGDDRYVVQCTVPEVYGALHIFSGEQLEYNEDPDPTEF